MVNATARLLALVFDATQQCIGLIPEIDYLFLVIPTTLLDWTPVDPGDDIWGAPGMCSCYSGSCR